VFSKQECEHIIKVANKYEFNNNKRDTIDHQPEHQIDIYTDDEVKNKELYDICMDMYHKHLPNHDHLKLGYVFLRRYNPNDRNGVAIHFDESTVTMSILLSDTKEFEGGKLYVFDREKSSKFDKDGLDFMENTERGKYMNGKELPIMKYVQGDMVMFKGGKLFHGITPVTGGERYILSYFFD
jgi:predicted 2-oxoglutarate/Fe(II)-dependent dioxygenase YbiX